MSIYENEHMNSMETHQWDRLACCTADLPFHHQHSLCHHTWVVDYCKGVYDFGHRPHRLPNRYPKVTMDPSHH